MSEAKQLESCIYVFASRIDREVTNEMTIARGSGDGRRGGKGKEGLLSKRPARPHLMPSLDAVLCWRVVGGWVGVHAPGEAECGRLAGLEDGAAVRVAARAGRERRLVEVDLHVLPAALLLLPAALLLADRSRHPAALVSKLVAVVIEV